MTVCCESCFQPSLSKKKILTLAVNVVVLVFGVATADVAFVAHEFVDDVAVVVVFVLVVALVLVVLAMGG